jgi:probable HAF family extracellular repeat protein
LNYPEGPPTINNFGQIGSESSVWIPTAANATSGVAVTLSPNARVAALNNFGQAVMNMYPGTPPLLFTPVAANGATGTLTAVTGLAGASQHSLQAINDNGTIVGTSCVVQGSGGCQNRGFLWRPTVPNGTSGAPVEIAVPAGFAAMNPTAINNRGDVVGTLTQSTNATVPFLYTAGTIYDLSAGNPQLGGAMPTGINDAGQIVLNSGGLYGGGSVYLATPTLPAPPPDAGAVKITFQSNPSGRVFTVTGNGCAAGVYTTPATLDWTPGANCTVSFVSPHSVQVGTQYAFLGWHDGVGGNPRLITAPAQARTYTATFLV